MQANKASNNVEYEVDVMATSLNTLPGVHIPIHRATSTSSIS